MASDNYCTCTRTLHSRIRRRTVPLPLLEVVIVALRTTSSCWLGRYGMIALTAGPQRCFNTMRWTGVNPSARSHRSEI